MPVDTAAKRFSMMNLGSYIHLVVLMPPDGTIGQGDRQHLLDCYSGVLFAGGAPAAESRSLILQLGGG